MLIFSVAFNCFGSVITSGVPKDSSFCASSKMNAKVSFVSVFVMLKMFKAFVSKVIFDVGFDTSKVSFTFP